MGVACQLPRRTSRLVAPLCTCSCCCRWRFLVGVALLCLLSRQVRGARVLPSPLQARWQAQQRWQGVATTHAWPPLVSAPPLAAQSRLTSAACRCASPSCCCWCRSTSRECGRRARTDLAMRQQGTAAARSGRGRGAAVSQRARPPPCLPACLNCPKQPPAGATSPCPACPSKTHPLSLPACLPAAGFTTPPCTGQSARGPATWPSLTESALCTAWFWAFTCR